MVVINARACSFLQNAAALVALLLRHAPGQERPYAVVHVDDLVKP